MCEIVSAGSAVPQTCKSLDVSPGSNIHQINGFKTVRSDQLGLCLQSLESKPQWWTSYSNSKQNAMMMCKAARVDIEKGKRPGKFLDSSDLVPDELIKLYKSVVETNANANAALSRANEEANDGLSQVQSNFALVMQMFQDQVTHEIEVSSTKTQSYFEKLVKGMDTAAQSLLSTIGSRLSAMQSDAATLSGVSRCIRSRCISGRPHVWLTYFRMYIEPMLTRRIWRRILGKSFSRFCLAVQS